MASFVSLTRHSLTTYYVQHVGTHTAGAHTQPGLLSQTPGLSNRCLLPATAPFGWPGGSFTSVVINRALEIHLHNLPDLR